MSKKNNNEATVESISSKEGKTILKVKKERGGVGLKVKGTTMEMLSVIAALTQSISIRYEADPTEVAESALDILGIKVKITKKDTTDIEDLGELEKHL